MIGRRIGIAALFAVLLGPAALAPAAAQNYPTRVIRLIVPYPPAGPTDVIARIVASGMSAGLGQSVIVENRPGGAAGTVGGRLVATAEPDGYTLLVSQVGSLTIAPALYKLDYDPLKDFAPVAVVAQSPEILTVNPRLPANSLDDFLAYAKANPGKIDFASPGVGTLPHLLGAQLQLAAGIRLTHVPYRGAAPAITDLLAGQVQATFDSTSVLLPHIESGRLRPLVVTSRRRIAQLANVPTVAEAGYPQLEASLWTGLLAPAGTPAPIIDKLNAAVSAALKTPDVQASLRRLDIETVILSPQQFRDFMTAETRKWAQIVAQAGIKGETSK